MYHTRVVDDRIGVVKDQSGAVADQSGVVEDNPRGRRRLIREAYREDRPRIVDDH
jgi:hypothetical protein